MQSRIYVIYNSNAYSRAYSGIQQCCGPLCIPRCAMCILKYTTHGAANTEHKGRLPTKHIASHNTNSTEGPLWGSPHICSKYREQLGARRTINVQTFNRPDIMIIITSSLNEQQRLKISRGLPAAFHRRRAYLRLQMQASATHASSYNVGVCECVWSLCECVYLYYRLVQASVTYAVLGVCRCVRY